MALKPGQAKCIETLDRSIVVAAGAGSGKTFTLTKRIVHAIECGAVDGIDRICAITFTNKAAGELKSRIKSELRACGLAEQALMVDEAWVSTIHGMCARILRAHAIELDLDPKFKMADAALAQRLQTRAVDRVLLMADSGECSKLEGWPSRKAVDALFSEYPARSRGQRGVSVESMLGALMDSASGNLQGYEAFELPKPSANPERLIYKVLGVYGQLADAARAQKPNAAREAFAADVEQRSVEIRADIETGVAVDALWALHALDKLPKPKRVGPADYTDQVAEALEVYRTCVMELRLSAATPHLETLALLARQASMLFDSYKRAEGVLDNNDLLVLASRAIGDHPDIAALYSDKFQLVMVDEFQDTDQMQVDMIKRLAGPGARRLCTVGDAQQSIYRFRGADVSVYRRHLESVRAGSPDDVIMLPDNFRSHPDVLAFVDRVFERADMFGGEFMSLAPGRDESRVKTPFESDLPRIQVQLTSKPSRGAVADQVREVAAARIADVFADLHRRGHSAGEMAVLLGRLTHADIYANALRERGLACVITGGSVFSSSSEVAIVLDMARVVANPYRTQPLFNVLTSPLFELDAGDLLELVTVAGEDDGVLRRRNLCTGLMACVRAAGDTVPDSWSPKLQLAVRVMGGLMGGADRSLMSRVLMRAVVDSGWVSRLEARGAEGLASAANVYKAIRMIESIEREQASGPARTAELFQVLLDESKEAPGALSSTGGDFVRIMTVHASKGLEFPIVAVGEFKDSSGDSSKLLMGNVDGKVMLSLDLGNTIKALKGQAKLDSASELYDVLMADYATEDELLQAARDADDALGLRAALYEHDALGDEEEAKRLLYVALTRAKEALVVSLMGTRTKDNPLGTPKSCLGALVPALAGEGASFDVGVSHFDYKGSAKALVDHVALEPAGSEKDSETENTPDETGLEDQQPEAFAVPAEQSFVPLSRSLFAPAHEGVFSYSSISDASHEGDVLDQLAQAFSMSVDAGEPAGFTADVSVVDDLLDEVTAEFDFSPSMGRLNRNAAVSDEDDGSWAYTGSTSADSDKATDLGTAFHRLAQYAVIAHGESGALTRPPQMRIDAFVRAGNLDEVQQARLSAALDRWFGSDLAMHMAAFNDLRAEVPFFVALPAGDGQTAFLEGEIDLLALDGNKAVVVDYKTGGHANESADDLQRKHVLQAACYACAIMRQGVQEVEAVFVRVERPRELDGQPQCVRYRFKAADLPLLETVIAQVYKNA